MGHKEDLVRQRLAREEAERERKLQEEEARKAKEQEALQREFEKLMPRVVTEYERVVQLYEQADWSSASLDTWPVLTATTSRFLKRRRTEYKEKEFASLVAAETFSGDTKLVVRSDKTIFWEVWSIRRMRPPRKELLKFIEEGHWAAPNSETGIRHRLDRAKDVLKMLTACKKTTIVKV